MIMTWEDLAAALASWIRNNIQLKHLVGAVILYWCYRGGNRVQARDEVLFSRPQRCRRMPSTAHQNATKIRGGGVEADNSLRILEQNVPESPLQVRPSFLIAKKCDKALAPGGGIESESLRILKRNVPESTVQERQRFFIAKKGDVTLASSCLRSYIDWRTSHTKYQESCSFIDSKTNNDTDEYDWDVACALAIRACREIEYRRLPRVVRTFCQGEKECVDRNGFRLIQLLPGRMDERLAPLSTYALAIALYIDRKLARDSNEKITVIVDVRGGQGWRNIPAAQLVLFMKDIFALLLNMFPERLARAIILPVPSILLWIWSVVQRYLDPDTAKKICLITGPAGTSSPPPSKAMSTYLDGNVVALLESERIATFDSIAEC
jgi:CRAL/TRIO domain